MATKTAKATKTYIDVAYKDRDLAKRLGARWDASAKRWYCPSGSTLALIYKWRRAPTPAELAPAEAASVNTRIDRDLGALEAVALEEVAGSKPAAPLARISRVERRRPYSKLSVAANTPLFDGNLELPLAG